MPSNISEYVFNSTSNSNLKKLVNKHLIQNNPKIYNTALNDTLNFQDQFIYNTILARSFALNEKYQDALLYYDKAGDIVSKNKIEEKLIFFFKLNYSISLGYLGKLNEHDFEKNITPIIHSLEKYFIDDAIKFSINLTDFSLYNRIRGLPYHIKNLERLITSYPDNIEGNFIHLRLGILYLIKYYYSNSIKNCSSAKDAFLSEINSSNQSDYRNYWAKCGFVICVDQLREKLDSEYLNNPPDDFRSRATSYPIILYLITKAKVITGDTEWVNSFLRRIIEKNIQKQINDFYSDIEYQNIIINKYKMIIEEWMYLIYQDYISDKIDTKETCKRLIKVNEIYHYKILGKKMLNDGSYRNNLTNIIEKLKSKNVGSTILYTTNKIHSMGSRSLFFIIAIDFHKDKFYIETCPGSLYDELATKWYDIINKSKENKVIEEFLDYLTRNTGLNDLFNYLKNQVITISNDLFKDIPLPLISNQKYDFQYWPNLSIACTQEIKNETDKTISILYDAKEENATLEAKTIKNLCANWSRNIHDISECVQSCESSIIHCVCHFDGEYILRKNKKIHYYDFFEKINSDNKIVVLNMCKSSSQLIKNNIYDSLPLFLILKGVQTVICHRWDLGQRASLNFTKFFYTQLNEGHNISNAFNDSLIKIKEYKKIEYGGYMLWGNGNIMVKNGS